MTITWWELGGAVLLLALFLGWYFDVHLYVEVKHEDEDANR